MPRGLLSSASVCFAMMSPLPEVCSRGGLLVGKNVGDFVAVASYPEHEDSAPFWCCYHILCFQCLSDLPTQYGESKSVIAMGR